MKVIIQITVTILFTILVIQDSIAQSETTPTRNKRQATIETPIGKLKIDLNERLAKEDIKALKKAKKEENIYQTETPLKISIEDYKGDLKNLPSNAILKKESTFNVKTGKRTTQKYVVIRPTTATNRNSKLSIERPRNKAIKKHKEN